MLSNSYTEIYTFHCRLHMVFSSPRHLIAASACIIVMEIVYRMDFSLTGFVICSLILGFGMFWILIILFEFIFQYAFFSALSLFFCLLIINITCSLQWNYVGIYEATSLERNRKDSTRKSDLLNEEFDNPIEMSSLPTWSTCILNFSFWNMTLFTLFIRVFAFQPGASVLIIQRKIGKIC